MNRSRWIAAGTSVGALVAVTAGVAAANPARVQQLLDRGRHLLRRHGTPNLAAHRALRPRAVGAAQSGSGSVGTEPRDVRRSERGSYWDPSGSVSPPGYDPRYDGGGNSRSGGS